MALLHFTHIGGGLALQHQDQFVKKGDPQKNRPERKTQLRNPYWQGQQPLRHFVEFPTLIGKFTSPPCQISDGYIAHEQGGNLKTFTPRLRQAVDQQRDTDKVAVFERMGHAEKRCRSTKPCHYIIDSTGANPKLTQYALGNHQSA